MILQLRTHLLTAGQWCAVACLFTAPINKPATSVLLALSMIFSLSGQDTRVRWAAALREPVVVGFLIWLSVLCASALHAWIANEGTKVGASSMLTCLYPALIASLLRDAHWRWRALAAFAMACALVVAASYLMQFGLIPQRQIAELQPSMRNTIFKEYTQQGLASLIFMSMLFAGGLNSHSWKWRWILVSCALLVLCNLVFLIQSRTTYIVLMPLLSYWIFRMAARCFNARSAVLASMAMTVIAGAVVWSSPNVRDRLINAVADETKRYVAQQEPTSTGTRLWLWKHTLSIAAEAPMFGHGLGQWEPLYRERMQTIPESERFIAGHPHQEMLLILAEQGTVGLLIYAALLLFFTVHSSKLQAPQREIFISVLIIYLTAGLANGLWSNYTHRHVFTLVMACIPYGGYFTTRQRTQDATFP